MKKEEENENWTVLTAVLGKDGLPMEGRSYVPESLGFSTLGKKGADAETVATLSIDIGFTVPTVADGQEPNRELPSQPSVRDGARACILVLAFNSRSVPPSPSLALHIDLKSSPSLSLPLSSPSPSPLTPLRDALHGPCHEQYLNPVSINFPSHRSGRMYLCACACVCFRLSFACVCLLALALHGQISCADLLILCFHSPFAHVPQQVP